MTHSFDVEIAKEYGILEAVIINHFDFWLSKNRANQANYHDGDYWTYNSTAAFQELFPYASKRQIERALQHLRDEDIIKVGNYNAVKYDRTLWYAFTEKGKSISRFGEMEITEKGNGNHQTVTPIPDSKPVTYTGSNTDNTPSGAPAQAGSNGCGPKYDYDSFKIIYNSTCPNLPSCRTLTDKRKKAIRAFLKEFSLDQWQEICQRANKSSFLTGGGSRGWRADIDFLLKPDKAAKIWEGGYQEDRKEDSARMSEKSAEERWGVVGSTL